VTDRSKWFRRVVGGLMIVVLAVVGLWSGDHQAAAQDEGGSTNLLTNGSLERPYYGQGSPTRTVPQGWNLWVGTGAPDAFPHTDTVQVIDGEVSWNLKQGYVAFTAAGYQRVGGLTSGDVVKATAFGWVYTCNNTENSCIIEAAPYRQSDTSAGASLKVGIDPNGGTDPNSADVKWSAAAAPYDQWAEMSVTATASGDSVTVFLYMSQAAGLALNNVYWDKASLVRTEAGEGEAAPAPAFVPFVVPQGVRPDGSIVHVVQAGDTLSSIAYAYSDYSVTIESIAALNETIKPNTRFLQIGQEIIILPPGSVDPVTGQPVPAGGQPSQPAAQPTPSTPQTDAAPQGTPATDAQSTALEPAANYAAVRAAYMPFERGFMFWLEDTNEILVLMNSESEFGGTYSVYQDTWREGQPETDPNIQPPQGFVQPDRGFGQAWRNYPGVRDALGWGTGGTHGYTALVVRAGDTIIINGPDNRVYQLLEESAWQAIDLYAPDAPAPQSAPAGTDTSEKTESPAG
jgi:LysM repeat protein